MPNHYARATALPNVCGRLDYISNPDRQEHLLAFHDGAADLLEGQFWHTLASECRSAFEQYGDKTKKCCEGREIVQPLSNALLQRMDPEAIAKIITQTFKDNAGLTVAVAIHQNKKENNLHAHIIFPERQLLQEPVGQKVAERNLFFDETGKRRYKKAEILDENKELRPGCKIVKKGELYGEVRHFGSVEPGFSRKGWLQDLKTNVLLPMVNGPLKGDIEFTQYNASTGKLAQQHIGKDATPEIQERIRVYNQEVKVYNRLVDTGIVHPAVAADVQAKVRQAPERNRVLQELVARLLQICRMLAEKKRQKEERREPEPTEKRRSVNELMEDAERRADKQNRPQGFNKNQGPKEH